MSQSDFLVIGKCVLALAFLSIILGLAPTLISAGSDLSVLGGLATILGGITGMALCTTSTFNSGFKALYAFLVIKKEK
ncbi:hypothetical protein vBRpoSV10_124 [Ruegeria phage vB_RpoS-V10]|nr:hypothetical protein vBRpoSV10_124 [Ruegeria phage vB_RpoS-V10]